MAQKNGSTVLATQEDGIEASALDALASSLTTMDQRRGADLVARGYELAGPLIKLNEGQGFEDVTYLGDGGIIQVRNPNTKELGPMQTAAFKLPKGGSFRILKDAGLTSRLPDTAKGKLVAIFKGGQTDLGGGRRVNEWTVLVKDPQNGAARV